MTTPLELTFRNVDHSDAVESLVRKRAEKLEHHGGRLTRCLVVVEMSQRRHQKGNLYHVRIDAHVGDKDLVVCRDPSAAKHHEDIFLAVHDSFDAAEKQLKSLLGRWRERHERPEPIAFEPSPEEAALG